MNFDTNKILKISMGGRWMRYPLSRWLKGLVEMIQHIQQAHAKIMVEIGCFSGESTEIFAQYFLTVYAVDIWDKNYFSEADANIEQIFDCRMGPYADRFKKLKMKGSEAVKEFKDKSLDFVYIDGSHWYEDVKEDITLWLPKVKPHGFIGGHDFWIDEGKEHAGVVQAVCEKFGYPDKTFDDFSWIIETKEEMYGTEDIII